MATRTFTNGGVDNLWSTPGNWDGGATIPVDNDVVVIAAGQTCEYDGDMSNAGVWPNGIDGLTITGTPKLTRTAGTYYLKIKAAKTILGAGTFDCGASAGDAIPFAAKHTITGGAAWYIQGSGGLTMTVYAAEPAIKTVYLTGVEAIGSTVLDVDTDVTGDIWADGDSVRIDNVNYAVNSEARVIAAGGIAAGSITVTAGLTASKIAGTMIHLMTRNVKFIASSQAILVNFVLEGKVTIAGGEFVGAAGYTCVGANYVLISGGTFTGTGAYAIANVTSPTVSGGIFSGSNSPLNAIDGLKVAGGTFSGVTYAIYSCPGATISGGAFKGTTYPIGACAGVLILGGTFSNNTAATQQSSVTLRGASLGVNTYDLRRTVFTAFNTLFGSATDAYEYARLSRETYSESLDHNQVAGAFKAWTKGGVTSSQAVTLPTGYTQANQTVLENASVEGYWQKEYTVGAGASINITMNLRKSAAMAYLPRCIIFNKAATDPFAGGAGLNTFTMTNSVDTWEASTYTYYNGTAEDVTLVVRFQGMNASGNMFSALLVEQINVDLTAVLAALAVVDANVDAILVDTGTDIPAAIAAVDTDVLAATVEGVYSVQDVLKFMAGVLAGKSSGGGTGTITFRDLSDTLDRVVADVDANGNRTLVTLDNS